MVRSSSVERAMVASLLEISGRRTTPMEKTFQPQKASSTTAATSGRARCCKHHSRL